MVSDTKGFHDQLKGLAAYYRDIIVAFTDKGGRHLHDLTALRSGAIVADLGPFITSWQEVLNSEALSVTLPRFSSEEVSKVISRSTREEETDDSGGNAVMLEEGTSQDRVSHPEKEKAAEALLAMYRKQEQDLYGRETLVGFPILCGTHGSLRYCAPLFYLPVRLEYQPLKDTMLLLRQIETPVFNTPLLGDLIDEEGVIDVVRKLILPRLHSEEFNARTIADIVDILGRVVPALNRLRIDSRDKVPLEEVLHASSSTTPTVAHACVAVNARKSHTFLLDDLAEIAKLEAYTGGTAVDGFLAATAESIGEIGDPDSPEQPGPLLFPLESNPPQRRVARKVERSRLTAVEGPPGTGKSQTIANLVCHLVAHGRTVLVTSHQNKALEVVMDKLPKLEDDTAQDYLAMAMLKGEAESARQLATKLRHFDATVAAGSGRQLELALKEALYRVEENMQDMRRLRARFSELKHIERKAASGQERYYRYHDIREYDGIEPTDQVPEEEQSLAPAALRRWAESLEGLRGIWGELCGLLFITPMGSAAQAAHRTVLLKELTGICDAAARLAADPIRGPVVEPARTTDDTGPFREALLGLSNWLSANRNRLTGLLVQLAPPARTPWSVGDALVLLDQLGTVPSGLIREVASAEERSQLLVGVTRAGPDGTPSSSEVQVVERALLQLEQSAKSWVVWHLSRSRRHACRRVSEAGFAELDYATRLERLAAIRLWVNHWQARYQVAGVLSHAEGLGLPVDSSVQPGSPPLALHREVSWLRRCVDLLQLLSERPKPSLLPNDAAVLKELIKGVGGDGGFEKTLATISRSVEHLDRVQRLRALQEDPALAGLWEDQLRGWDRLACSLTSDVVVADALDKVKGLLACAEDFVAILRLEEGELHSLPHTLGAARAGIVAGAAPAWLRRPELAMEAYRLRSLIRSDVNVDPDDIGEVARRLRELGQETRQLIVQALRRQRRLALWQAVQDNRTRGEIDRLRRLLTRRRKTSSLMELRDKVNYGALLKVFPCWVMGIEDVARVFPLAGGLFDYVIVDEASQCSQATALHLAYRAQRMVVVGDEKQLQNPWVRFLRDADMRLLLQKHGLDRHPNWDVMEAKVSLLGLAARCANSQEFLDEHFRSEPAIIGWSNEHFYGRRLRILTPIWPRRFEPCMEVAVIAGADDDPDDTHANILEAKAVMSRLRSLLENPEYEGLTFGLISPFREQADLLQDLIYREMADRPEWIRERRLVASTADGFQGDERDIILYSMRYGPSSKAGSIHAIEMEKERLNVAFTRARRQAICFVSVPPELFPSPARWGSSQAGDRPPSIRGFLDHAAREQRSPAGRMGTVFEDRFDSRFEQDVCQGLRAHGLKVYTQVPCAGYRIDQVVMDEDGRRLAVECDGDFHYEEGDLRPDDYHRQDIIERAGWAVHRVSFRRFYDNPQASVNCVLQALLQQPTESDTLVCDVEQRPSPAPSGPSAGIEDMVGDEGAVAAPPPPTESATRFPDEVQPASRDSTTQACPLPLPHTEDAVTEKPTEEKSKPMEGLMAESRNWYALSQWGKQTELLLPYDRGFAFSIGRYLRRGWPLSPKQNRYAMAVWKQAVEQGFEPPQGGG